MTSLIISTGYTKATNIQGFVCLPPAEAKEFIRRYEVYSDLTNAIFTADKVIFSLKTVCSNQKTVIINNNLISQLEGKKSKLTLRGRRVVVVAAAATACLVSAVGGFALGFRLSR